MHTFRSPGRHPVTRVTILAAIVALAACRPYSALDNQLGVLPVPPPQPLWLGAMQPPVDSALRGSVAVTQSATPRWSHVLVSIAGARPATTYTWALHSGRCADNGAI
ncbi:MAG TPA: hypothetical protein VGT98_17665, partial [Candidatus Elarobacter sp.]|nr:hypothetical protein [Candidatus Elarobacter sp.]